MAHYAKIVRIFVCLGMMFSGAVIAEQSLTLDDAIQMALTRDALTNVYVSRSNAYKEQAIAEDTLPDPKLKFGFRNFPTDTFAADQEPMTQIQLGIQQKFPRGDSLKIKSLRATSMSLLEAARTENQQRKVRRDVSQVWLEYFYWLNAEKVVLKNRDLFHNLVSVTRQQYAAGRQKQQDVIRSELELGMLDDRQTKIKTMLEMTQAKLSKYIGEEPSQRELVHILPELNVDMKNNEWLEQHPMMLMEQARVNTKEKNVALARQSYKPSWMLDLTYGKRGGKNLSGVDRPDFLSAIVVFDLPLFTANRQDKKVAASKYRLNSAMNSREERRRELQKMWDSNKSTEARLVQRIKQYKILLVPKAKENAESALFAYQSGRSEFTALMRARITELETQLRALRLEVDLAKTRAQLLYLVGGNS